MAKVAGSEELLQRIRETVEEFKGYDKVHIIGGGQSYATAHELARALRRYGILAEAQLNDSAWHGPLAIVEDTQEKFEPGYDASRDGLIIILATDSRFYSSCLLDTSVYKTRNARVILVVQEGDENIEGIRAVNPDKVLVVPKAPDLLTNPSDALFSHLFAVEFAKARGTECTALVPTQEGPSLGPEERRIALIRAANAGEIAGFSMPALTGDLNEIQVFATPFFTDFGRGRPGIVVIMKNQPGIIRAISRVLAAHGLNSPETRSEPIGEMGVFRFVIEDMDYSVLTRERIVSDIRTHLTSPEGIHLVPFAKAPTLLALDSTTQESTTRAVVHAASLVQKSGIANSVPVARRDDWPFLAQLRMLIRRDWFPEFSAFAMAQLEPLMRWTLRDDTQLRRSLTLDTGEKAYIFNPMDGTTPLLTGRGGSNSYIVYGEAVKRLGAPPRCPANILAAYVPKQEAMAGAERALLNPNRRGADILETLEFIARRNGLVERDGTPDLTRLRVVVTDAHRERERIDEFSGLQTRRGLEVLRLNNGESSLPYVLRSYLPPVEGGPLTIVWTGCGGHQAFASLALTNGLENSWMSFNLISENVNNPAYQRIGYREVRESALGHPLHPYSIGQGGALDFTPEEAADIERFIERSTLPQDPSIGDILEGRYLFTPGLLVGARPTSAVIVPLTNMEAFGLSDAQPFIPGVATQVDGPMRFHVINVRGGATWIQEVPLDSREHRLPDQLAFTLPEISTDDRSTGAFRIKEGPDDSTGVSTGEHAAIDHILRNNLNRPADQIRAYAVAVNGQDIGNVRVNADAQGEFIAILAGVRERMGKDPNTNYIVQPGFKEMCEIGGVPRIGSHEGHGLAGPEGRSAYIDEGVYRRIVWFNTITMDEKVDFFTHLATHLDNPIGTDENSQVYEDRVEELAPTESVREKLKQIDAEIAKTNKRLTAETLANEDSNTLGFEEFTRSDRLQSVSTGKIGLIVPASFILENMGTREVLERLRASATDFAVVVDASNEAERRVVEMLELPIAEVVVAEPGAGKKERIDALTRRLRSRHKVIANNIGRIENPAADVHAAIAELKAMELGIHIGVPQAVEEGQLVSARGVFHDVIDAIVDPEQRRGLIFAIQLPPIEAPSADLQRGFEEYREGIAFLIKA